MFCRERIRRRRNCGRGIRQEQCPKPAHHTVYAALTPKDEMAVSFSEVLLPTCLSDQRGDGRDGIIGLRQSDAATRSPERPDQCCCRARESGGQPFHSDTATEALTGEAKAQTSVAPRNPCSSVARPSPRPPTSAVRQRNGNKSVHSGLRTPNLNAGRVRGSTSR